MSFPRPPQAAKLVIGLFMSRRELIPSVSDRLVEAFGAVDMVSPWFEFRFTDYYEPEMGTPLYRRMLAFLALIQQDNLADIKLKTNAIEDLYVRDGRRAVNIDPAYMLRERFVLATGKNFSHRIYIGRGIYADLTLTYRNGAFKTLEWTYPDYAEPKMQDFLTLVRKKYIADLKRKPTR
jgi:hypothetical protein